MKRKKYFILLFSIALILNVNLAAQGLTNPKEVQLKSPQISSMEKVGLVPAALNVGQINPSISIYNFSTPHLDIPIVLDYSNSGLKIGENATWVGLGWNLVVGGAISQNIKGIPDDGPAGMLYSNIYNDMVRYTNNQMTAFEKDTYVQNVSSFLEDSERDIFTFNLLGRSGSFFIDASGVIRQFQRNDLRITYTLNNNQINSFTVTDEKGNVFLFNIKELSSFSDGEVTSDNPTVLSGYSWYLSSITSQSNDIISFVYDNDITFNDVHNSFQLSFGATSGMNGCTVDYSLANLQASQVFVTSAQKKLSKIITAYGTVDFITQPIREDLKDINGQKGQALTSIEIKNNSGIIIRKASFAFGHFLDGNNQEKNRLKLNNVSICGKDCLTPLLYQFTYFNETSNFPPLQSASYDFDHWGYYNGAGNSTPVPYFNSALISGFGNIYYGANKNSNSLFSRYGMLKTIKYPTGGTTEFEYEGNKVDISSYNPLPPFINTSNPANYEIGGNRIKSISYIDPIAGLQNKQFFEYSSEIGLKYIPNYLSTKEYLISVSFGYNSCGNSFHISDRPQNSMPGFPIEYSSVTEKNDINAANGYNKKTFSKSDDIGSYSQPFPTIINTGWRSGQVLTNEDYRKDISSQFTLVKKDINSYATSYYYPMSIGSTSLKISRRVDGIPDQHADFSESAIYTYFTEQTSQTSSTTIINDGNNNLSTSINYYYESLNHFQKTREAMTSSKGENKETRYYYVNDFDNVANSSIVNLKAKNINTILRTDNFSGSGLTLSQVNSLNNNGLLINSYSSTINTPLTITSHQPTTLFRANVNYTNEDVISYGVNNQTSLINHLGNLKSYLWDYNYYHPICEVVNADTSSIAYTSFESDGKGYWTFSGAISTDDASPTGRKYYGLSGGNITRSGLVSGAIYIISYWKKDGSGSATVNSVGGNSMITKNGWTLYEHEISGTTSITISGSGSIDELRLYPKGSFLTSYTYDPLIGITSQCDVNNRITYYEYDEFGRLKLLRDMDRNITKTMDYKYAAH